MSGPKEKAMIERYMSLLKGGSAVVDLSLTTVGSHARAIC